MTPGLFDSAEAKLSQAERHVAALRTQIFRFFQEPVATLVDGQLELAKPIPSAWSATLGDALQNMRAALDHAACAVVAGYGDDANLTHRGFPILEPGQVWNREMRTRLTGAPDSFVTLVRALQWDTDTIGVDPHPLVLLHQLAIVDRHRSLPLIATLRGPVWVPGVPVRIRGNHIEPPNPPLGANLGVPLEPNTTHHGSVRLFEITFTEPALVKDMAVMEVAEVLLSHVRSRVMQRLQTWAERY